MGTFHAYALRRRRAGVTAENARPRAPEACRGVGTVNNYGMATTVDRGQR